MIRFTTDGDTRNMRAMAVGLSPAPKEARMRFALPSGISSTRLSSLRDAGDRCAGMAAVPGLMIEPALLRRLISAETA